MMLFYINSIELPYDLLQHHVSYQEIRGSHDRKDHGDNLEKLCDILATTDMNSSSITSQSALSWLQSGSAKHKDFNASNVEKMRIRTMSRTS